MSPPADIQQAIDWLAPKPCGIPLLRYGGEADGGYLIPDDLEGIRALFSPGANNVKSFEDQLALQRGIACHICDFNSELDSFQTPLIEGLQHFDKKWLDVPPASDSLDINDWVESRCPGQDDLILQMDIEGAEYRNLLHATDETLKRFRIIVVELHGLGRLSRRSFVDGVFLPVVARLSKHFVSVHAHPNNCCGAVSLAEDLIVPQVMELTLLRRDRVRSTHDEIVLPNPQDKINVPGKAPLFLRGAWLRHADRDRSNLAVLEQRLAWLENAIERGVRANNNRIVSSELNPALYQSFIVGRENLASGKPTDQSSQDVDQPAASSGASMHWPGIHTRLESNPWWVVDLQAVARIGAICLFSDSERAVVGMQKFVVSISDDARQWTRAYVHRGRSVFAEQATAAAVPDIVVPLLDIPARYVRLSIAGTAQLNAGRIEIWGKWEQDTA